MMRNPYTWIEINKSALEHNLSQYKKVIGPQAFLGAVVKSNAYGHGMLPIAQLCQASNAVDWLCVSTLSEAITLRKINITKPILVVYFIETDPSLALAYDIDLMVSDYQTLEQLNHMGIAHAQKIKIHLKIDSGMSRFGFLPHEALAVLEKIKTMAGVQLQGIYSHLAQAANDDQSVNRMQEAEFYKVLDMVEREHIAIPFKHLSNTAGTTSLGIGRSNLVRVGLGIYGWWPSQSNKDVTQKKYPWFELKPVLTLKSRIHQVREIGPDCFVGYDRTFKTTRRTKIAVLPIGYYDGYDRRLSSKGITLIRGHYAPVIGIIAMTSTLIDVTDIPGVQANDEVVLMGDYEKITPTHLANVIGSFNAREIMTRLNPEIPRVITEKCSVSEILRSSDRSEVESIAPVVEISHSTKQSESPQKVSG